MGLLEKLMKRRAEIFNDNSLEKEKIRVLINENRSIRSELIMVQKTIHNCIFGFITFLGVFVGVLINLITKNTDPYLTGILAFALSQVEIVLVVYSLMLSSDMFTKAAYVKYIEKKINSILKEDIIFWESEMSPLNWKKGTMMINSIMLYIFYFAAFASLAAFCYNKLAGHLYLWIQILETLIIFAIMVRLSHENDRMYQHILGLKANIETQTHEPRV